MWHTPIYSTDETLLLSDINMSSCSGERRDKTCFHVFLFISHQTSLSQPAGNFLQMHHLTPRVSHHVYLRTSSALPHNMWYSQHTPHHLRNPMTVVQLFSCWFSCLFSVAYIRH